MDIVVEATRQYQIGYRNKVIVNNLVNPIAHAYYHEYRSLQRLCILILKNEEHQIGYGTQQIYGILFDGAWLWEEYVNQLIGNVFYHPMNKANSGVQKLFAGGTGSIYPDFISRESKNRVIADAKYKPMDNIGNKDYLQILAYMLRFDSKKGFYLYPEKDVLDDKTLRLNCGSTYEKNVKAREDIAVTKIGLFVEQNAENYDAFVKLQGFNENSFIHRLFADSFVITNDNIKIAAFSKKWIAKFRNPEVGYIELVDHFMADECDELGFAMDTGDAFAAKYGKAVHDPALLKRIITEVDDMALLGSAIYSRWRYFNHWSYSGAAILRPENKEWFIVALSRMEELATGAE